MRWRSILTVGIDSVEKFYVEFAFWIFEWVKPWIGVKMQLSNFAISFVNIRSTLKKSLCLSRDHSEEVAPIVLKFRIDICIWFLKNPIDFGNDLLQIVVFTAICICRSRPKSIGFLWKHIQISMQNFRSICATTNELSRDKKLTTYTQTNGRTDRRTDGRTDKHTYIHFWQTTFFST